MELSTRSRLARRLLPYSLKYRLLLILLLCTVLPILLIGGISYFSISSILQNKIELGVAKNLKLERESLEGMLENLDYASAQLALDGKIGSNVKRFVDAEGTSVQQEYKKEIDAAIMLTSFTNPNLGLMTYYMPARDQYLFETLRVKKGSDIFSFPVMTKKNNIVFYGPHHTIYRDGEQLVFSITREITTDTQPWEPVIPEKPEQPGLGTKTYIYMETNFKVFDRLLNSESYGFQVQHLLTDAQHRILYSDDPEHFKIGSKLDSIQEDSYDSQKGRYLFQESSEQGWGLVAVIDQDAFNAEKNQWLYRFFSVGFLMLVLSLLLGWSIWRMIYRPIRYFKQDIRQMANNQFDTPIQLVNIKEYDDLLGKFHSMKERIQELIREVEQKEKHKRDLEVEKLLYQINPHFLHNTLNTIQWIAMMNKQEEIVRLISTFTRVLHYNLAKEGRIVSIHQELEALRDYLDLQHIRYNHKFNVRIEADDEVERLPVPRFLLQPLVENAIYHGFKNKDGIIDVTVKRAGPDHVCITVEDNGDGMSPEAVKRLLVEPNGERRKVGLGIGLNYVNQMIKVHFGDRYRLEIESHPGRGTKMTMLLPNRMKEDAHDTDDDR